MLRPRLMTDQVIERLVEGSRMGLSLGNAAEFAGISRRTLTYWLTRGCDQALAISAGQTPKQRKFRTSTCSTRSQTPAHRRPVP